MDCKVFFNRSSQCHAQFGLVAFSGQNGWCDSLCYDSKECIILTKLRSESCVFISVANMLQIGEVCPDGLEVRSTVKHIHDDKYLCMEFSVLLKRCKQVIHYSQILALKRSFTCKKTLTFLFSIWECGQCCYGRRSQTY